MKSTCNSELNLERKKGSWNGRPGARKPQLPAWGLGWDRCGALWASWILLSPAALHPLFAQGTVQGILPLHLWPTFPATLLETSLLITHKEQALLCAWPCAKHLYALPHLIPSATFLRMLLGPLRDGETEVQRGPRPNLWKSQTPALSTPLQS